MIRKKNVNGLLAFDYLKQELAKGRSLSAKLNNLSLDNGSIQALVPEETSDKKLYQFEEGSLYFFDKELKWNKSAIPIQNDAKPLVVDEIRNHLNLSERNCCLFEEPIRVPSDFSVTNSGIEYIHLNNNEMFYFFNQQNNNGAKIKKALLTSEAHIFLCALSSLDISIQNEFLASGEISLAQLEKFVDNISYFFVKAYDHEGYLMWVRKCNP